MSGKRCETTVWWSENVLPPWKLLQWPRCPGIHRSAPNAGLHSTGGRRCQGPRRDLDQETRQSWKFNLQKVKLEKFSDCCANWLMWSELNWIELVWCIGVDNSTGSNSRTDAKTGLRRKHLFLPICGTIHCIPPAAFSGRLACEKQHTHTHTHRIHYCTSHLWWQQKGLPKHPKASWRVGYSSSKLHYHWQDASHLKCI